MKPVMNIDEFKFDDVEENGLYSTVPPPGNAQCRYRYGAQS
jgi:hypothetical protein